MIAYEPTYDYAHRGPGLAQDTAYRSHTAVGPHFREEARRHPIAGGDVVS